MPVYEQILIAKAIGRKLFAVLLDPDKQEKQVNVVQFIAGSGVDMVFVGGSGYNRSVDEYVGNLRRQLSAYDCHCPVVLFPGDICQFSQEADALLFLSLISGRNADLLIGRHVRAAKAVRESGIETIPMGYILVDGGKVSTTERVTGTAPLQSEEEIVSTALAGEMLGQRLIYLEAGSGAKKPVSASVISSVSKALRVPLIVGGGIRSTEQLIEAAQAGADLLVVGNHFETHPEDIPMFAEALKTI